MEKRSHSKNTGNGSDHQAVGTVQAMRSGDDASANLSLYLSWFLVASIGLMPLVEASFNRSPSITMPMTVAFFVAVGSAILLRRHYSWVGLVLHIYGQVAIWLSLFVMSLALVLFVTGHA